MTTTTAISRPRYGNWIRPRSAGFFGMTWGASMVMIGVLMASMFLLFINILAGVICAVIGTILLLPLVAPFGGRTGYERVYIRMKWTQRKLTGAHQYRSGPFSKVPGGRHRLPGILAHTDLYEALDALGNRYGIIHMPRTAQYTVIFACSPQGDDAIDPNDIDTFVANWGQYISILGEDADVDLVAAVVETIPETGQRLRSEQARLTHRGAPTLAKQIMREGAEQSTGLWQLHARLAVTLRANTPERKRDPSEMAVELGGRLPEMYEGLSMCGVGASPMPPAEIAGFVRRSYDPDCADTLEEILSGDDSAVSLTWDDCGPSTAQEAWDTYTHDSGVSAVLAMEEPPRGNATTETILRRLLSGHHELPRKRLAMLYRPHSPGDAATITERDYNNAVTAVNNGTKAVPSAATVLRSRAAAKARDDEAEGHGLVRFGSIITITALSPEELPRQRSVLKSLTANARIKTRPTYGYQAPAFAAGLGIGLVLPDHYSIPQSFTMSGDK
ncbi:SCO6880 family protein [Nocardia sp. 348MFTsu5.1]|uniref:SCO6880 family protein n=1 Tax=Nocardia sp. 348MFTsu5.1 TaxID=1172185 RepID=UPI0003AA79BE|nr:SCO6880 family protein [Nocardia sp. 348MFTsu5.1]